MPRIEPGAASCEARTLSIMLCGSCLFVSLNGSAGDTDLDRLVSSRHLMGLFVYFSGLVGRGLILVYFGSLSFF